MSRLRLLEARLSADYLNPGDPLWVTLSWQAESPALEEPVFALDIVFGHQRRLENKAYEARVTGRALPPVKLWRAGEIVETTLKWDNPFSWSGSFHLTLWVLDSEGIPQVFVGEGGREVKRQAVGTVDVSWNLGRPWAQEHAQPRTVPLNSPAAPTLPPEEDDFIILEGEVSAQISRRAPILLSIGDAGRHYPLTMAKPIVTVRHRPTGRSFYLTPDEVNYTPLQFAQNSSLSFEATARIGGEDAAAFVLSMKIEGRALLIAVVSRREYGDYELTSVSYPALAETTGGYLVDFFGGGRLVAVDQSLPAWFEKKYDVRNAAALYDRHGMLVVESTHMDSRLVTGVAGVGGRRIGVIGGSIICRIPGEAGVVGIPVASPPVFSIELPACERPDWRTAARLWRRGLRPNPARALYRDCYLYKQLSTFGPLPDKRHLGDPHPTTRNLFKTVRFEDIVKSAVELSRMTDWARQVLYIAGWQRGGFDNAYPEPYDAEERCGGLEGLRAALEELRGHNILSGLHDNFDDICSGAGATFPHTAIDESGAKWRGWMWAAGPTYIMGFKKYVESGGMRERVRKMTELLPLKDTYHLDVLTAEPWRVDYDPRCPSSAEDSFNAKIEIVAAFAEHGIDITSELLTHRAVGHIGFALHTRLDTEEELLPGDSYIPLVPMIYHGVIGYSAPSNTKDEILWGLLIGGQTFHEVDVTGEMCVSRYYIQNIPATLLYDKVVTDFERQGDRAVARYGENSWVEADFGAKSYQVVVDGVTVGKNFSTLTRGAQTGSWLAYSFDGIVYCPLPEELTRTGVITATRLTTDGDAEPFKIDLVTREGCLRLEIPPMAPFRLTAHER